MNACALTETADIELFFYDELDAADRARVAAHVRDCAVCRARLDDLHAIRRALAAEPVVDAPPAGDWSGFMRRLDAAVRGPAVGGPAVGGQALGFPAAGVTAAPARDAVIGRTGTTWSVRHLVALAATLVLATLGVFMAARVRQPASALVAGNAVAAPGATAAQAPPRGANHEGLSPVAALREVSAEHLERSKLVILGLATRDPRTTQASDWQYERQLAGSLLAETRLYRLTAQERGVADVAHVMRDLETVLLEASMSDGADRESLERVQRLIVRRGLVSKMQMVATTATAGL